MKEIWLALLMIHAATCTTAFSGDDKFLKKYAMMKVYESCFGQEVVKEVRMEMKAAASKCAGISPSAPGSILPPLRIYSQATAEQAVQHKVHPQVHHKDSHHSASEQSHLTHKQDGAPEAAALHAMEPTQKTHTLDLQTLQKLQEAIAGYSTQVSHHPQHAPQHQTQTYVSQQPYSQHHIRPYHHQAYQPAPAPVQNSLYYPQPAAYQPPPQYVPSPYSMPYQQPIYPQAAPFPAYYQGRSSRDLDVRGQLETLSAQMSGRIRNVTCVMQELGYLDGNMEPDYGRMIERIGRLPVSEDLKKDMTEGVDFCRQFSQCVPDDRKDKLIQEMVRPMFFFRCYKHKKLEACIMKDVRERYNQSDDLTEDNLTSEGRAAKEFPEDNMATAIYEFLYGDDKIDIDTLL